MGSTCTGSNTICTDSTVGAPKCDCVEGYFEATAGDAYKAAGCIGIGIKSIEFPKC